MLSVIKLQGVKIFSADPAYTPLTECQAANGMVLNATPQKKCEVSEMTQWTSTISSDALQRLSCGSEMFYSISCKLAVQESPN